MLVMAMVIVMMPVQDARGKVVEEAERKRDELVAIFRRNLHNKYDRYFRSFIGCEVLNLAIVVSQVAGLPAHPPPGAPHRQVAGRQVPHLRHGGPHLLLLTA